MTRKFEEDLSSSFASISSSFSSVQDKWHEGCLVRKRPDRLYTTSEDFARADPRAKRVLVVGGSGVGKSTLLNILGGGYRLVATEDNRCVWQMQDGDAFKEIGEDQLLFYATDDAVGVTQNAVLAHLSWFGDDNKPFIAIDTVGVADPELHDISKPDAQDVARERAVDLHDKLTSLGHVDVLLVLHGDAVSGRINSGVMEVLQMLDAKFPTADFWNNVVLAFTRCNECDRTWKLKAEKIHKKTVEILEQKFPRSRGITVPIVNLGGLLEDGKDAHGKEFEKLWNFIQSREKLDTSKLLQFDDAYAKYKKRNDEAKEAEARLKAQKNYTGVVGLLFIFCVVLFP
jgi:hypothetical protein